MNSPERRAAIRASPRSAEYRMLSAEQLRLPLQRLARDRRSWLDRLRVRVVHSQFFECAGDGDRKAGLLSDGFKVRQVSGGMEKMNRARGNGRERKPAHGDDPGASKLHRRKAGGKMIECESSESEPGARLHCGIAHEFVTGFANG